MAGISGRNNRPLMILQREPIALRASMAAAPWQSWVWHGLQTREHCNIPLFRSMRVCAYDVAQTKSETAMPTDTAAEQPFQNLTRQTNKLMEQLHKGFFYPNENWTPNVNLYETGSAYLVCVDLAGVDKEKIDVEVADQRLKLRGARATPSYSAEGETQEKVRVHLMEIDHGAFTREVEIPADADRHNISATYRNGLLWIEIPKEG